MGNKICIIDRFYSRYVIILEVVFALGVLLFNINSELGERLRILFQENKFI